MSESSIKKAALINFISRYSNIFIQLVINSILARILTPDDYGIVAVITVFITFFTILADMGIGPAIIQNKELDIKEISDIFIFTFFTSIIIGIGFSIFSYGISIFYSNKVYIYLGQILAISVLFNILNIVPNSLILKAKKFKLLGIRNVLITLSGGIFTIILAVNGFSYYSLALNSVFVAIITFIVNFYSSKLKIFFSFNKKSINKIRNFSSYQFGFNFINYFSRNLDNLLIGKIFGSVSLGYYDKAYKLMLYPVQNLTYVISPVLHPILSDHQNDKEYVYNTYLKVVRLLSLLGIFFTIFCFFSSKEIIVIMFGEQWLKSVNAFEILSISMWPQIVTSSTGSIFQSLGETKRLFRCGLITTSINVVCLIVGILSGTIETVAKAITVSYILSFIIAYFILIKYVFEKNLLDFLKQFIAHIIIGIIMIGGYCIFKIEINNNLISCLYKGILGMLLYLIGLIITKEITYYMNFFRKKNVITN